MSTLLYVVEPSLSSGDSLIKMQDLRRLVNPTRSPTSCSCASWIAKDVSSATAKSQVIKKIQRFFMHVLKQNQTDTRVSLIFSNRRSTEILRKRINIFPIE